MLTPYNLLPNLRRIPKGQGVRVCENVPLRPADGTFAGFEVNVASAGTDGSAVASEVLTFVFDGADSSSVLHGSFYVPYSYDKSPNGQAWTRAQDGDQFKVRVIGKNVGGNDAITLTCACTLIRAAARDATAEPTITDVDATCAAADTDWVEYTFDFSGNGIKPGDGVNLAITSSSANSGDDFHVLPSAHVEYKSCIVAYDEDDR